MTRQILPLALALVSCTASAALAAVPSPLNSTVPTCFEVVPGAAVGTVVIVRDIGNTPILGASVKLSYGNCAGFVVCPGPDNLYLHDLILKTISLQTDALGQAAFYLRAGGGCTSADLQISADGIFLGSARVTSADQNGDLVVDGTDFSLETAKVGTSDLSGDLNCDGVVNTSDVNWMRPFLGLTCANVTPTRSRSWGDLKLIYR